MHSIPASFQTLQRIFLVVGAVGLAISCAMTAKFGFAMSTLHAIALCTVTVMAAFILPAREFIRRMGFKGAARALMVAGVFFIGLEFFSDLGYTIGMRDLSTQTAGAMTVAYDHEQASVKSEAKNLDMWRKQLADLQEQNKWSATVTADALRAQLASADKAIDLEGKRGGCKSKCLALMQKKGDLEGRIAIAEEVTNLNKRIEATQRILDGKTETAVHAQIGFSPVRAQTDFVAQLWNIGSGVDAKEALNPDQVQLTVTQILIGFFIALGVTFIPTTAFYLAFFGQRVPDVESPTDIWARQAKRNEAAKAPQGGNTVLHNHEDRATYVKLVEGDKADDIRRLIENLKKALPAPAVA
jgi:hypothetical protein